MDRSVPAWRQALSRDDIDDAARDARLEELALDRRQLGARRRVVRARRPVAEPAHGRCVAIFVIGARQLGFAVLMHEAAHRTLFRNRRVNDWVGNWLCAYPVWSDLYPYRPTTCSITPRTWTADDPDLALANPFPDHAREPPAEGLARPLRADRLEAPPGDAQARPRSLARSRAAQLRRRSRGAARRR